MKNIVLTLSLLISVSAFAAEDQTICGKIEYHHRTSIIVDSKGEMLAFLGGLYSVTHYPTQMTTEQTQIATLQQSLIFIGSESGLEYCVNGKTEVDATATTIELQSMNLKR